jgi:hypothetical protein
MQLGLQRKKNRNERGFLNLKLYRNSPNGWLGFLSMLDDDRDSIGFFRCGSLFVAKFRYQSSTFWLA